MIKKVEILTHNGVISPSDIQEGAETLSDVTYSKEVDRIISGYQWVQGYTIFDNVDASDILARYAELSTQS